MLFRSLVFVLALVVPLVGTARDVHADKKSEARELFLDGSRRYDLHDYDEALKAFRAAYLKIEDPSLLFNIAQCHRALNQKEEAIKFYRTFLSKLPTTEGRAQVEKVIADLEKAIEQEKVARANPPQGTVLTPDKNVPVESANPPVAVTSPAMAAVAPNGSDVDSHRGRSLRIAGLAVGGFGILALGAGGGFVGGASAANDQIVSTGTFDQSAQDRRDLFQSLDIAFFAIGAVAVATGTTLFLLGRRADRKRSVAWSTAQVRF